MHITRHLRTFHLLSTSDGQGGHRGPYEPRDFIFLCPHGSQYNLFQARREGNSSRETWLMSFHFFPPFPTQTKIYREFTYIVPWKLSVILRSYKKCAI